MLHILFLPGTFGTTINHVLKTYTKCASESTLNSESFITADGSMHGSHLLGYMDGHWNSSELLMNFFNNPTDNIKISTPLYPMPDLHADRIIELFKDIRPQDRYIFIHVNDVRGSEINMLMQYYKIAKGTLNKSVGIFCGNNEYNIMKWNQIYTHWNQMHKWELREWLSLFYMEWIQEWIDAKNHVPDNWFKIRSEDIIENTFETFVEVCNYYDNLDLEKIDDLKKFATVWRSKQQYIIDEYTLINNIVDCTINRINFSWDPINIISESIIQQKLRMQGYEIKCYNLNDFPTNSLKLNQLLEKI